MKIQINSSYTSKIQITYRCVFDMQDILDILNRIGTTKLANGNQTLSIFHRYQYSTKWFLKNSLASIQVMNICIHQALAMYFVISNTSHWQRYIHYNVSIGKFFGWTFKYTLNSKMLLAMVLFEKCRSQMATFQSQKSRKH